MDLKKMGGFLKELRRERGLTQEQFAEVVRVSSRTISRWETGANAPDLDVLIDISEFYGVDLRDILDGERKDESMDKELKETVRKVAEYSSDERERIMRRMHLLFVAGTCVFVAYFVTLFIHPEEPSALFDFLQGMSLGISFGLVVLGTLMTSAHASSFVAFKRGLLGKAA